MHTKHNRFDVKLRNATFS